MQFVSERLVSCDGTESRAALLAQEGQVIRRRPRNAYLAQNRNIRDANTALLNGLPVPAFLARMAHCFDHQFGQMENDLAAQNRVVGADDVVDERNDVEPGDLNSDQDEPNASGECYIT
jgi:hypothetical protein